MMDALSVSTVRGLCLVPYGCWNPSNHRQRSGAVTSRGLDRNRWTTFRSFRRVRDG